MKPETLFHQLLGLNNCWQIDQVEYSDHHFTFKISETEHLFQKECCCKDGESVKLYDHVETRSWRHLNVFSKECLIECALPRVRCTKCGRVYRITPPWEGKGKHFSKEFEAFALTLCREMPVSKAAEILGETDNRLWRMLKKDVSEAHENLKMNSVGCVGVDEMSIRKGHNYLTVFADLEKRRVIFATKGRDSSVWDRFATVLERHEGDRNAIHHVSMDMSTAYQKGVRENCRNAVVVFDKFHIIAHANKALDEICRSERMHGSLQARKQLRKTRWLWRKNPENLTEKQRDRMEKIDHEMLYTSQAYQMKLSLQNIYKLPFKSQASRRIDSWCNHVRKKAKKAPKSLLMPMIKISEMIQRHKEGILAHWDGKITNAFMEGLNSVFSATKRKARGYRNPENLITMLYFVAGKLDIKMAMYTTETCH